MEKQLTLTDLISPKIRLFLYLSSLSTLLFVQTYCTNVCPFIDGLFVSEIVVNLTVVFLFHIAFREILNRLYAGAWKNVSLPRQGYYLSIISWLLAGVVALIIHAIRYTDFPFASHLKLLSSYWILGGGILAQLEYIIFEYRYKKLPHAVSAHGFSEKISRRILESFFLFTMAPTVTLVLIIARYNYEHILEHKVLIEVLYIGGLFLSTALLIALLFGRMLREDTDRIVEGVVEIESGNFTAQIDVDRSDELGEISQGINAMAQGLANRERIKEAFGKFVDPGIAETFIKEFIAGEGQIAMGGQRRYAVILMADIRNFTELSETMPPDDLIALLNEYFIEMVAAVNENGGIVDKFIGDAIMAVFGLPEAAEAERKAYETAVAMRTRLAALNERFKAEGMPELDNGIGIHGGEVTAGYLGSEERLEFTVIGAPVNLASRIEQETKRLGKAVLFSRSFAEKLPSYYKTAFVSEAKLKGISQPVRLYTMDI